MKKEKKKKQQKTAKHFAKTKLVLPIELSNTLLYIVYSARLRERVHKKLISFIKLCIFSIYYICLVYI